MCGVWAWSSLSGKEATGLGLEGDNNDGDLEVALLLQLSQNSGPEKDLTLTDPVQVWVQVQVLNLQQEEGWSSSGTISTAANSLYNYTVQLIVEALMIFSAHPLLLLNCHFTVSSVYTVILLYILYFYVYKKKFTEYVHFITVEYFLLQIRCCCNV